MGGVLLWGWDDTNKVWVKVLVNAAGKLIIDPTEIFENPPTDGETGKAPQSDWAYDHAADPDAHHARQHAIDAAADHTGRIALTQMTDGALNLVLTGQGAGVNPAYAALPSGAKVTSGGYTGNGTANRAIAHGLGAIPKLVFVYGWNVSTLFGLDFPPIGVKGHAYDATPTAVVGGFYTVTTSTSTNFYVGNSADYTISGNLSALLYSWVAIG